MIAAAGRPAFRPAEERGIAGPTVLACGYLAAWLLFEPAVAAAAIVVAGLADPAAALVGGRFGRGRGKSLPGSAACAVAAAGVLAAVDLPVATSLAGGLAAALSERAPWRGADNALVPVSVCLVLTALGAV